MKNVFVLLLILICFSSCKDEQENIQDSSVQKFRIALPSGSEQFENTQSPQSKEDKEAPLSFTSQADKKKIIKDGSMSIRTESIAEAKKNIDTILKKIDGYYEKEETENNSHEISHQLMIRVPAIHFDKLIIALENGGNTIVNKSIQARDITEEYVDIQTRLAHKRAYLQRYRELLAKAQNIDDIVTVENSIRTLEEEIESKEGRLRYLDDQVAYSTLHIRLFNEKEYIYEPQQQGGFIEKVKRSLSYGWIGIVEFTLWMISLWPIVLLVPLLIVIIKRIRKKRKISARKE